MPAITIPRITLGISACLLGERVRYNGEHKRDRWITERLSQVFRWIPVCPEVEIGLGIPRAPIQLEWHDDQIRLVEIGTHRDLTERMDLYAREITQELHHIGIRGFILKRDSPSCGLRGVPVYNIKGQILSKRAGQFAYALQQRLPLCPLEEEERLHQRRFLKQFFIRVFTYDRWQRFVATHPSPQSLHRFHRQHSLLIDAHHPRLLKKMNNLVYASCHSRMNPLLTQYGRLLMKALRNPARRFGHARALTRILEEARPSLSRTTSAKALHLLTLYRRGNVNEKHVWLWFQEHIQPKFDPIFTGIYFHPYPPALNDIFHLNPFA